MKTIINPNLATPGTRPSWAGPVALAGMFLVLGITGIYLSTKPSKTSNITLPNSSPIPPIPKVDYQALVNAETSKAREQSQKILAGHKVSLVGVESQYAMRFSLAAYEASASAAEYKSILTLIGNLAWDQVKSTNGAESHLKSRIEPSITRVMSEFNLKMNSETAKFDNDLQKITVQMAANIASIGPGASRPQARVAPLEDMELEFKKLLKNLGWETIIIVGAPLGYDIVKGLMPGMLRSLNITVRSTALRMFAKQVARVAALPLVAAATGPIPIGAILAIVGILYTGYDMYQLQTNFESDVNVDLRAKINQVRYESMDNAEQYALSRAKKIQEIQSMIATKALINLTDTQSK